MLILILSGMRVAHVGEFSLLSIGFRYGQGSHKRLYIVCQKIVIFYASMGNHVLDIFDKLRQAGSRGFLESVLPSDIPGRFGYVLFVFLQPVLIRRYIFGEALQDAVPVFSVHNRILELVQCFWFKFLHHIS